MLEVKLSGIQIWFEPIKFDIKILTNPNPGIKPLNRLAHDSSFPYAWPPTPLSRAYLNPKANSQNPRAWGIPFPFPPSLPSKPQAEEGEKRRRRGGSCRHRRLHHDGDPYDDTSVAVLHAPHHLTPAPTRQLKHPYFK